MLFPKNGPKFFEKSLICIFTSSLTIWYLCKRGVGFGAQDIVIPKPKTQDEVETNEMLKEDLQCW